LDNLRVRFLYSHIQHYFYEDVNLYLFEHIAAAIIIALLFVWFMRDVQLKKFEIVFLFALGAALPDLIDKPLYYYFGYGRSLMHSAVIITILFVVAFYLFKDRYRFMAVVFYAMAFLHYIMDSMWKTPEILLYPLMGWAPEFGMWGWTPGNYLTLLTTVMAGREAIVAAACLAVMVYVYYEEEEGEEERVKEGIYDNP
jgi:hypothetical protein